METKEQPTTSTHFRTCPLCEATCGLEITVKDGRVSRIRGDRNDVFSKGFICPKGSTLADLDDDPDRIRVPMIRDGETWREVSWDEAFDEIRRRLPAVAKSHGRDAIGLYIGNPTAHHLASSIYVRALAKAVGSRNFYSASTVDQMPKQVSAGLMFGAVSVPVPDIDRCDLLVVLGADPYESNGSLWTAPDLPDRFEQLRARGGRVVVVDPRRSKTAEHSDLHLAIKPGTDAFLLLGILHVLVADGLIRLGRAEGMVNGLDAVCALATRFDPNTVSPRCGIGADQIRTLAHDLAAARRAAVYGRIGTCVQEFGTLTSWLIDVINVLTGNLDSAGGAMFPLPVAGGPNTWGTPGIGRGLELGRWTSRVRGLSEAFGELPAATLADEIEAEGVGQVRALITMAGNPVLSTPNGARLGRALGGLDFMVSIDMYRNETTRHAHVLLPAPPLLSRSHYDVLLYRFAVRSVANWSAPVFALQPHERSEGEVLLILAEIIGNVSGDPMLDAQVLDDRFLRASVEQMVASKTSPISGRSVDEIVSMLGPVAGPDRHLDLQLRTGPFGDNFAAESNAKFENDAHHKLNEPVDGHDATPLAGRMSLSVLQEHPHGVDFGPMVERLPGVLRTPTGCIELAPDQLLADADRLISRLSDSADSGDVTTTTLEVVGRRQLRSNNSWMHNVRVLMKGRERCTLLMHPSDAMQRGLVDGASASVCTSVGTIVVKVEVSDAMRPGVVSLPHGWGHVDPAAQLTIAAARPGASLNDVMPENSVDPLSGTAVLTGVRVVVSSLSS